MIRPNSDGSVPLISTTEGGVSLRIYDSTVTLVSPLNGRWPVAIS